MKQKIGGGASAARNKGIEYATGDYLTFVDSDDWIDEKMYQEMLSLMLSTKSDFCLCNVSWEDNVTETSKVEGRNYFIERIYLKEDISFNLWNTLVKRDKVSDLFLDEDIWLSEDNVYILEMLLRIEQGVMLNKELYHHLYYNDSLSHSKGFKAKHFSRIKAVEKQAELLKMYNLKVYKIYRHVLLRDYVNVARGMAAYGVKKKEWIRKIQRKIRGELFHGSMFYKRVVRQTVFNGVIISISFDLFYYIYRWLNKCEILEEGIIEDKR